MTQIEVYKDTDLGHYVLVAGDKHMSVDAKRIKIEGQRNTIDFNVCTDYKHVDRLYLYTPGEKVWTIPIDIECWSIVMDSNNRLFRKTSSDEWVDVETQQDSVNIKFPLTITRVGTSR